MIFNTVALVVLGAVAVECGTMGHVQMHANPRRDTQALRRQAAQNKANPSCLDPSVIATNSGKTGQETGQLGIKAGQALSATDANNFINFCKGKKITNGLQVAEGSCNTTPMGNIPSNKNMISAILTNPLPGQKISAFVTFDATVSIAHLQAGKFTNPTETYYSAPQDINGGGDVIGHCHITIQDIGTSLAPTTPPDASKFAFFKGIDDAGDGKGNLKATVTGGLPAGFYRMCTINSAGNHQPAAMPVAQRGHTDDCTKFEVVADGKGTAPVSSAAVSSAVAAPTGGAGTGGGAGGAASSVAATTKAAAATTKAAAAPSGKNTGGKGNGGFPGKGGNGGNAAKPTTAKASAVPTTKAAAVATSAPVVVGTSAAASAAPVASGAAGAVTGPGPALVPVTPSGQKDRPFQVAGNTFVNESVARQRACDLQFNACADAANSGKIAGGSVAACSTQKAACK